jgi:hypothetical protein
MLALFQHREAEDGESLPAAGRGLIEHRIAAGTCAPHTVIRSPARYLLTRLGRDLPQFRRRRIVHFFGA